MEIEKNQTNEIVDRLRMRLDRESGMGNLSAIAEKYSFIDGKPFSFASHEFQKQIIDDTSSRISVRKCSQVGLTELMIQKTLALCATLKFTRIIFTLPTATMAASFSKDRIDGAVDQSPFYSGLVERANNSASQKKIGSNTLYISGSYSANAAISIPAELVIADELDHSNPVVIGKLNSRLRHASRVDEFGNRGMRFYFSTPTVSGFGIDAEFQKGTQQFYQVKCKCCNHWQIPMFDTHFRIPNYNGDMKTFSRSDAYELVDDLDDTTVHCEKCDADLLPSLIDPDSRQWVANFPGRSESSYNVSPLDVPTFNTPPAIVKQIMDYPLKSDFANFVLGLPYSDSNNSFITDDIFKMAVRTVDPIMYLAGLVTQNTVIGVDTGRECYLTIGIPMGRQLHICYTETIHNTRETPGAGEIIKRFDYFRCAFGVVDSMPDISLANELTRMRDFVAAVYVRDIKGAKFFEVKPNEPVVNIARTKALTFVLDRHNSRDIRYPKNDAMTDQIFTHMATTHKVRKQNLDGSFDESFMASSTLDHALHSLAYTVVAAEHKFGLGVNGSSILAPVSISRVQLGSANKKPDADKYKHLMIW